MNTCDVTAIEVGAGQYLGAEEISVDFFPATSCLYTNPAGKNPDFDF